MTCSEVKQGTGDQIQKCSLQLSQRCPISKNNNHINDLKSADGRWRSKNGQVIGKLHAIPINHLYLSVLIGLKMAVEIEIVKLLCPNR